MSNDFVPVIIRRRMRVGYRVEQRRRESIKLMKIPSARIALDRSLRQIDRRVKENSVRDPNREWNKRRESDIRGEHPYSLSSFGR